MTRKMRKPREPDKNGMFFLQIRIHDDLRKDVDHLAVEWNLSRSETVTRLLKEAICTYKPIFTVDKG